jgi:hypothetical protein
MPITNDYSFKNTSHFDEHGNFKVSKYLKNPTPEELQQLQWLSEGTLIVFGKFIYYGPHDEYTINQYYEPVVHDYVVYDVEELYNHTHGVVRVGCTNLEFYVHPFDEDRFVFHSVCLKGLLNSIKHIFTHNNEYQILRKCRFRKFWYSDASRVDRGIEEEYDCQMDIFNQFSNYNRAYLLLDPRSNQQNYNRIKELISKATIN